MSKSLKIVLAVALSLTAPLQREASAQVNVGENVNVLPVHKSAPPASDASTTASATLRGTGS